MGEKTYSRKLTAVLSADVKGYSKLMSENEDHTISTLTKYRGIMSTKIKKYYGRVVDSPGDNLLAEFSNISNAIKCAFAIQKSLTAENASLPKDRQMIYRIGINVGNIIHEGQRIYGDGVNIAARLESLAEPGGICISGTAFDQVKNNLKMNFAFMGEKKVKNIAQPVRAYKVLMDPKASIPLIPKLRLDVLLYCGASFATVVLGYMQSLRYLIADTEKLNHYTLLNPLSLALSNLFLQISLGVLICLFSVSVLKQKAISRAFLRFPNGCYFFSVSFIVLYLATSYLPLGIGEDINKTLHESNNLFVQVNENGGQIYKSPNTDSDVIQKINRGDLFLLNDVKVEQSTTWNKVLIGKQTYGWVQRVIPAKVGVEAKRLTLTKKFTYTTFDLGILVLGTLFFIFGFVRFKNEPK